MGPLLPVVAGLVALGAGAAVLRSFGTGYRIGRLLAATPLVSFEEVDRLAGAGVDRYVRIEGRLDSAEDFPDENARPLVFRRERLEAKRGRRWTTLEEGRRLVPFEVRDGLAAIRVDAEALDAGLVVLPRESVGQAADVPDRVPADLDPSTPIRYRVEQVSAVEHAMVVGVPALDGDGVTRIGPGLGRPLILSTVEPVDAMQLLAGGRRLRPLLAILLLGGGLTLLALGLGWAALDAFASIADPVPALAASPAASAGTAGDTRSAGEGPGLVGAPLAALAIVGLIALASVAATLAYVRFTGRRHPTDGPGGG